MSLLRSIFLISKTNICRYSSIAVKSTTYLTKSGVSKHAIDDNAFLLDMKIDTLKRKMEMAKQMRPRHIDDFVPLLRMEESTLRDVAMQAAREFSEIPEQHRIYYFSRALQIAPGTVSKYYSNSETIFFDDFTSIAEKLKILQDYNVDSMEILQSLYVLKCSKEKLFSRLGHLMNGSYEYKPSYIKLSDEQFRKTMNALRKAQEISVESPYKLRNRNHQKSTMVTEISGMLSCGDDTSTRIYYDNLHSLEQLPPAKSIMELLANNGVGSQFIQSNPVLLTLPYDQVTDNIQLIKAMRPKSIEDFLPLVAVKTKTLRTFVEDVNGREIDLHPVYLFSKELNIAPIIVSQHFARHSKLFFYRNYVGMVHKLNVLVAYNVEPMSILRSAQTFASSAGTLETRLKRFKAHGIEHILAYMVVSDEITEISVARIVEGKTVLGKCTDTVDYIAKRLNLDATAKEKALKSYPKLVNCSPIRVKNLLDYLLNETHFSIDDIVSTAYVFQSNLDEFKQRMNEMGSIGLVPRKLFAICSEKRDYLEMIWQFCEKKNCRAAFKLFKSIEKRVMNVKDD